MRTKRCNICDGKIIHCKTEQEAQLLITYLTKKGYLFEGYKKSGTLWGDFEDDTCYSINHPTFCDSRYSNRIGYAPYNDYVRYGCQRDIVEYQDIAILLNNNQNVKSEYIDANTLEELLYCLGSSESFLDIPYTDKNGCIQPFTESGVIAYKKLTDIIYAIGKITGFHVEDIVEKLDEICNET